MGAAERPNLTAVPVRAWVAQKHEDAVDVREWGTTDGQIVVHVRGGLVVPTAFEVDRVRASIRLWLGGSLARNGQRTHDEEANAHPERLASLHSAGKTRRLRGAFERRRCTSL